MSKRILQYGDKTQFEITEEEANHINNWLTSKGKGTHYNFRGQSLKSYKMEVLNERKEQMSLRNDYHWNDDVLTQWEKEIFNNGRKTFKEYLVDVGAMIVNSKYPNGVIIDHKLYIELQEKWNQLASLRFRQDKENGSPMFEKRIKEVMTKVRAFKNKVFVQPLSEIKERGPVSRKEHLPVDGKNKIDLSRIPF